MAQISPYNDSMRLGMGFNSFTQRLCNYAVRPVGAGFEAHPDPPQYKTSAVPHSGNISNGYEVMWTAKFVNTMSEVAQSLNISGAPQIRCDFAPPGGAKTSASFNDTNTFAESDINYLIQVRVSHQRFNHTEFEFIPNLHQSEFTRLYGDSFISGFVEGGEFNALISVKLRDRSDADQVKQQLEAGIGFTATARDLDQSQSAPIDGEITIAVSWKCGGDILDGGMTEWTLNSLKAIVMEFPRKATTCPMRINALLTKYTSLKGFREKDIQGALNYENTGLYTAALLDAYLDYKCICRSIQQISRKVEQGEFALVAKEEMVELAELFTEAKEMPNGLSPYKGSIYGLVKARKDCRIEMLKIIREVDTVEEQPQVACDLTRPQQYLDPAMFRMLLPTTQDLKKARAAAAQEQLSCADLTRKLEISERERTAAEISALGLANELNPYGGWCPVETETPVRFRAHVSGKSMDHNWACNDKADSLHQYEGVDHSNDRHSNQRFQIHRAGRRGFIICHIASGRYLTTTTGKRDNSRAYMLIGQFPSVFTFKPHVDNAGVRDGSFSVHFAEQSEYTLNVEGGGQANGTKLIAWPGAKGDCDRWFIESFAFHN